MLFCRVTERKHKVFGVCHANSKMLMMISWSATLIVQLVYGEDETGCWKEAKECPRTADSYARRASLFNCEQSTIYSCMLTVDDKLVELCTTNYQIPKNTQGCPVLSCSMQAGGLIVGLSQSTVAYCPNGITGCPNGTDDYELRNLLKYPKCLLRLQDRFSVNKDTQCTCNQKSYHTYNTTSRPKATFMYVTIFSIIVLHIFKLLTNTSG